MDPPASQDVLVVEDDAAIRGVVVDVLESEGYVVRQAAGGAEALRLLAGEPLPGLVLLDFLMPGLRGDELLAALRGDARTARMPVVLMTAATAPFQLEGADALLPKPFELGALLDTVARFCGRPGQPPPAR